MRRKAEEGKGGAFFSSCKGDWSLLPKADSGSGYVHVCLLAPPTMLRAARPSAKEAHVHPAISFLICFLSLSTT
jgi:hypothetical protein